MNDLREQMKKELEFIGDTLERLEDYTHGQDGEDVTKCRTMLEIIESKQLSFMKYLLSKFSDLKRYEALAGSGWGGSSWVELDEAKDGDLVKFEDLENLIAYCKSFNDRNLS